jgi:uncharacterized protein YutE (UPF0331/DUF86 family)
MPGSQRLLLLFAAVVDDVVNHHIRLQGQARAGAGVAHLLANHGVIAEVEAEAAIGLRDLRAE